MGRLIIAKMQLALAYYFQYWNRLIIPNCHLPHECDLIVVTQSMYAWEVEIKTSLADIRRDRKKWHNHGGPHIKRLYFAVPKSLYDEIGHDEFPEKAGILAINGYKVWTKKAPVDRKGARRLNEGELHRLYRLAEVRLWSMREEKTKRLEDEERQALRLLKEDEDG